MNKAGQIVFTGEWINVYKNGKFLTMYDPYAHIKAGRSAKEIAQIVARRYFDNLPEGRRMRCKQFCTLPGRLQNALNWTRETRPTGEVSVLSETYEIWA